MAKKQSGKQNAGRPFRTCPDCGGKMELVFLKAVKKKNLHWHCSACNTYLKKGKKDVENVYVENR